MKHLLMLLPLLAFMQASAQDIILVGDLQHSHYENLTDEQVLITDDDTEDTYFSGVITFAQPYQGAGVDIRSSTRSVYIIPTGASTFSVGRATAGAGTYIGSDKPETRRLIEPEVLIDVQPSVVSAQLSPVPTRDVLTLQAGEIALSAYELYDLSGRLLDQKTLDQASFRHELQVTQLIPGQYFLKLQLEDGTQLTKSFIKQ